MDTHDARDPAAGAEEGRLANRAASAALLSVSCFVLALMAMPLTFQRTEQTALRIAASTPLVAGVVTAAMARSARARLRAHRNAQDAATLAATPSSAPGDAGSATPPGRTGQGRG